MKNHRSIAQIFVLLAALAGAAPAAASASPLLSGYGGPGVGNQAILGSALLNGGGSAGGGSGPTGQGSSPSSVPSIAASNTAGERVVGRAPHGAVSQGAGSKVSGVSSGVSYPASERAGAASATGTLGLSGQNLLFILLALLALAFTGVLTRRMIGDARGEGTSS